MRGELIGSSSSGLREISEPTWWANRNPGIRYVRCELPARQLGGVVDFLTDALNEQRLDVHTGPQVFQLPATRDHYDTMNRVLKRGIPVFAEFDDDYTRWDEGHARRSWERWDRDTKDRGSPSVELVRACATAATGVIVSTQHLKDVYSELNTNVHVCRNSVDPADWDPLERKNGVPFRVLFAAAPNPADTAKIRAAMEWVGSRPDAEAIVVGQDPGWQNVRAIPWVEDLALLRRFMVGLAPDVGLRPMETTRFSQGKSDLKVLEYAMCGALSIVTPGKPYEDWSGLVGFARNSDEFAAQVFAAYEDRVEARRVAEFARDVVLHERVIEHEAHAWASALRSSRASHKTPA